MEPIRINYIESRKWHCARGRSVSLIVTVPMPSTKQTGSNSHVVGKRLLFSFPAGCSMRSFCGDVRVFCCNRAFHEENENNERDGDYGKNEKDVEV